jgi:hypothetical protein
VRRSDATCLRALGALLGTGLVLSLSARAAAQEAAVPAEAVPAEAAAEQESSAPSAWELSASLGPTVVFSEPANPAYTQSFNRVGVLASLAIAYRSPYFLDPLIEVGYAALADGKSQLPDGEWGAGGVMEQHLATWIISPGVSTEFWRFRARLGIGIEIVSQSYTFRGEESSSTQLPIASQLVIGFKALDNNLIRLDAEARAVVAQGAEINFLSFGLTGRFDIVSYGQP